MTRIMVVEDDEDIRDLLVTTLSDEGYEVRGATDGRAALQLLATFRPALILVDMRMPVMSGREFIQAYRAMPVLHARVVVMSAGDDAILDAEGVGADAVLQKPFEVAQLFAHVDAMTR